MDLREYLQMLNLLYPLVSCSGDPQLSTPSWHKLGNFLLRINSNKNKVSNSEVEVNGLRSNTFPLCLTLCRDALPDFLKILTV